MTSINKVKKLSEYAFNRIDSDAARVKDSPCSICGRKSVARMRRYSGSEFSLFAVCFDHIEELRKIISGTCS